MAESPRHQHDLLLEGYFSGEAVVYGLTDLSNANDESEMARAPHEATQVQCRSSAAVTNEAFYKKKHCKHTTDALRKTTQLVCRHECLNSK